MGLYRVPDPWNRGITQLNEARMIVRFAEKPPKDQIFSNLANAGIYVLEPEVLDWIPPDQIWDFGSNVFPDLLEKGVPIAGYIIDDPLIDIGLPEKYEAANHLASAHLASISGGKEWH
jgi:mannose-1-phosphate guanylyltransferase/phosphomannomutase